MFSDYQFQNGELDIQFYTSTYNRIKVPQTCWKGTVTYGTVIHYMYEHNTIYNIGTMSLNSYFESTDAANYLYNTNPAVGVQFYRLSENKNSNIIKNSLVKIKINNIGYPFLRYRIANQNLLMGTSLNWNLNVNHTTFSGCTYYFLYR